jgi:hypothetical protein
MSELAALARRLEELADDAACLAEGLGSTLGPRSELRDLLQREFRPALDTAASLLWLESVVDDVIAVVAAPHLEVARALADDLGFLVDDEDDDPTRSLCLDCGTDTTEIGEYYMLENEVWLEANPADDGMLCVGCVEKRLGRRLAPDDFMPLEMNHKSEWRSQRLRSRVLGLEDAPTP